MRLIDGRAHFWVSLEDYAQSSRMVELARRSGATIPPLDRVAEAKPLPARINHNRLIVDCPDCNGAEYVWRQGPHLMMCAGCWNGTTGGAWRRVVVPRNLAAIVKALDARPLPQTRNWQPGESVADLKRENAEHGVGEV